MTQTQSLPQHNESAKVLSPYADLEEVRRSSLDWRKKRILELGGLHEFARHYGYGISDGRLVQMTPDETQAYWDELATSRAKQKAMG